MHSTTSWTDLDLSSLKRVGTEFHGPCPVMSSGTDCFWVNPDTRLIGCRHCSTNGGRLDAGQFTAHLAALGGAESAPPALTTYEWTDVRSGDTVEQTRTGQAELKYLWPPATKTATLVYLARYQKETDRPIVWCEGAKAATAAARTLPADYDVVAFVSSSKIPSAAALETLATGRACIIWPDDDLPGAKVAQRLSAALTGVAASVRTIDPARLELVGGHGHDAEQWHPTGDPATAFEAACGKVAAEAEDATPLTVGLTEWLATMRQPPDVELTPDAPGLLYTHRIGVVHANRGVGKSTYAAWCAAAASHGGKVLVVCCDDPASWASRLESFNADNIVIGTMDALAPDGRLERAAHGCHAVIIDSWRRWLRAADRKQGGRSNSANDESVVGPVIDRLVDLAHSPGGPAVVMLANEGKSAEATTARGSFAIEDAVDFVRRITKEGDQTTISTAFKARIHIPTGPWRMRLVEPSGFEPSTGGGGGADPFTPSAHDPLDEKITGFLMSHAQGVSQNSVLRTVRGASGMSIKARLKVIGTRGQDGMWRCVNSTTSPPSDQVSPEAQPKGVETGTRVGESSESRQRDSGWTRYGTRVSHYTDSPAGPGSGTHLWDSVAEAKGDDAAKHERTCPRCFGDGFDAIGEACGRRQVQHAVAAFRLGVPTFSAVVGIIPAPIGTSQSTATSP